jgi:hypothetical protein
MDAANPLSLLRGNGLVWSSIFEEVDEAWDASAGVRWDRGAYKIVAPQQHLNWMNGRRTVLFPESRGLMVDMMPFKLFDAEKTLPEELWPYLDMIADCLYFACSDRVAYLTVLESDVAPGATQGRPGLHIKSPTVRGQSLRCGYGHMSASWMPYDGIFMASSVAGALTVLPITIDRPERVADAHGGIDHLKKYGKKYGKIVEDRELAAGELCWITDRTPHEANPNRTDSVVHHQFFSLVVGPVSVRHACLTNWL